MASRQYLNCSTQIHNSRSAYTRRGYSKAQMCFFKILHTISSIPPCPIPRDDIDGLGSSSSPSKQKGIGIDLNLSFCSVAVSPEFESFAENGSETSAIEGKNRAREEEAEVELSEAIDIQVQSFKVDNNGVDHQESESEEVAKGNDGSFETMSFSGKGRDGGGGNFLDLLTEAAKVVSAKDESNSEEPSEHGGLSKELRTRRVSQGTELLDLEVVDLYDDVEETPPVVRSKRGRNQVLPHRFRDSVVEPLKRLSRPQRPSSTRKRPIRMRAT